MKKKFHSGERDLVVSKKFFGNIKDNDAIIGRRFRPADRYWEKNEGKLVERSQTDQNFNQPILDGDLFLMTAGDFKNVILTKNKSIRFGYEPARDWLLLGPEAMVLSQNKPDIFLVNLAHEISHRNFFGLQKNDQVEVVDLFFHDHDLQKILGEFAGTLYGDKFMKTSKVTAGDQYLKMHQVDSRLTVENVITNDGEIGLKDRRSVEIVLDGRVNKVFLGLLVSELIAYTAMREFGQSVFHDYSEIMKTKRGGGDDRLAVVERCWQMIKEKDVYKKIHDLKLWKKPSLAENTEVISLIKEYNE